MRRSFESLTRCLGLLILTFVLAACGDNDPETSASVLGGPFPSQSTSGGQQSPGGDATSGSGSESQGQTSGVNVPPTISGDPMISLMPGEYYLFIPLAFDANGDALTFSIMNKPDWMFFDRQTGALAGISSANDVGTSNNIVISVSDGTATTELAAFSVTVEETANQFGTVILSWVPPTENADGSALTDLHSYRIYYGTSPDNLDQVITINNPGLSSYAVQNLELRTYYFAASAINSAGIESDRSNVVAIAAT